MDLFNTYFTSIESISFSNFIESHFNSLKKDNILITDTVGFNFSRVTDYEVKAVFNNLSSSSSPGILGIYPKLLKLIPDTLIPVYTKLFNYCIITNTIPDE